MKRTILFLALTLATSGAWAAEAPAPAAAAKPAASGASAATAQASSSSSVNADVNVKATVNARAELEEMREQMRELSRKMAALSRQIGEDGRQSSRLVTFIGDEDTAMVGIVTRSDPKGVRIAGLTPGGPAEKAGLRNGDVVITVDAHALDSKDAKADAFDDLKIGQNLKLGVLRDGKPLQFTVKAERREPWNWPRTMRIAIDDEHGTREVEIDQERIAEQTRRAMELSQRTVERAQREAERATQNAQRDAERETENAQRDAERATSQAQREAVRATVRAQREAMRAAARSTGSVNFNFRMPWWGLNLVALNDDLAGYFGTKEGVLVLSADADDVKLKSGDVLQAIGGEKVGSPEDAMRLLRDARVGSELKLSVRRHGKTVDVAMKAPDHKSLFALPPEPPEPPAPPAPPAPAPPAPPTPPAAAPAPPAPPIAAMPPPPAPPSPPVPPSGHDN